jgi:gas vesicle protein
MMGTMVYEESMMRKFFSFLMGTVMGALVGATVALLLAPESGEELRGSMRQRFMALQEELGEAAASRKIELEKQLANLRQPKSTSVPLEES